MPTKVNIPSINENQLDILNRSAVGKFTTIWVVPDAEKDTVKEYQRYTQSMKDVDGLIALGLLTDTSAEEANQGLIQTIMDANGRSVRVISITNDGAAMFAQLTTESGGIN